MQNESAKAYAAFMAYCEMGEKRSIEAVGKQLGKSGGLIERWSSRHKWVSRAVEWDKQRQVDVRRARAKALRSAATDWAKRQLRNREDDYQAGQSLRKRAKKLTPKTTATLGDISRAYETASKLERLACGIATEKTETEVTGPGGGPVMAVTTVEVVSPLIPATVRAAYKDMLREELAAEIAKANDTSATK